MAVVKEAMEDLVWETPPINLCQRNSLFPRTDLSKPYLHLKVLMVTHWPCLEMEKCSAGEMVRSLVEQKCMYE